MQHTHATVEPPIFLSRLEILRKTLLFLSLLEPPTNPTALAMADDDEEHQPQQEDVTNLTTSFLGLSFSLFLAFLPRNALNLVQNLQSRLRELSLKLFQAEEQLRLMRSRRQEDSKANARVVEIFASHRNAWQAEEKRMLHQIDSATEEIALLRNKVSEFEKYEAESKARIEELEREVRERDEMLSFMSRRDGSGEDDGEELGECQTRDYGEDDRREWFHRDSKECLPGTNSNVEEVDVFYEQSQRYLQLENGFDSEFLASASKFWAERATLWQDVQYESHESTYNMKQFVARRESPWKVDGDSAGVSNKLKLLEQELLNLENIGKGDLSKVPTLMRKQAKRYQALSEKIDDLCGRIASDPCEPTLSSEFRAQRQTEFLLEAFRLQQRASETGQKLIALQSEVGKSYYREELGGTRRSLDSIRNNLKEIQRNLEIWLARIIGDLEGILARDGASRVREYYISRYPFVQ